MDGLCFVCPLDGVMISPIFSNSLVEAPPPLRGRDGVMVVFSQLLRPFLRFSELCRGDGLSYREAVEFKRREWGGRQGRFEVVSLIVGLGCWWVVWLGCLVGELVG